MSKSKVASIRALQELKGIVEERLRLAYGKQLTEVKTKINNEKETVCEKLRKEIEDYAVFKYSEYGLIAVPVCHRNYGGRDADRVIPELKIKVYPGLEGEEELESLRQKVRDGEKAIEDWYFKAVQAVASQVDLPETPDFK